MVSIVALAVMVVVSLALGWVVAGRVLRPLRTITATTRQISEDNLHQRLGPLPLVNLVGGETEIGCATLRLIGAGA